MTYFFGETPPPPPPRRSPGVGAGVGIGIAAHVLGVVLIFPAAVVTAGWGVLAFLWPFILIALVGAFLLTGHRTRRVGTGILIVSAALWLIIIGPCTMMFHPLA